MAYDEALATRLRELIDDDPVLAGRFTEKKMFGGLAMMLNGNMAVGVRGDALLVRVDPDHHDELIAERGARIFDMSSSRQARGWLLIDPPGHMADEDLRRWFDRGVAFARSLPPK